MMSDEGLLLLGENNIAARRKPTTTSPMNQYMPPLSGGCAIGCVVLGGVYGGVDGTVQASLIVQQFPLLRSEPHSAAVPTSPSFLQIIKPLLEGHCLHSFT
jgi:hypothetical protein